MERYACRHCKADDSTVRSETKYRGHNVFLVYYVQCNHCGSRTRDFPDEASAVEAWNKACGNEKTARAATRTASKR